jgi:hypothetical protein
MDEGLVAPDEPGKIENQFVPENERENNMPNISTYITDDSNPVKNNINEPVKNPRFYLFKKVNKMVLLGVLMVFILIIIKLVDFRKKSAIGIIPLYFYWRADTPDIDNIVNIIYTKQCRKRGNKLCIPKNKYVINMIISNDTPENNILIINKDKTIKLPKDPNEIIDEIIDYRKKLYWDISIF